MTFYSQNGVDRDLIERILPLANAKGYAVDVGANDGACESNTLALEELGWTVLCIEPNPAHIVAGHERRKLWRQVACGPKDEEQREFWAYPGEHPVAAASSALALDTGKVPHGHARPANEQDCSLVSVRTLNRVLEEAGFPSVDVVTIDVEGYEKEVLQGFDIERWKPAVLIVESISYEMEPPPGYRLHGRYTYDNLFVRE